jgi:hypothetical protein
MAERVTVSVPWGWGFRWACFPMLSCVVLPGCVARTGDLFPPPEFTPPDPATNVVPGRVPAADPSVAADATQTSGEGAAPAGLEPVSPAPVGAGNDMPGEGSSMTAEPGTDPADPGTGTEPSVEPVPIPQGRLCPGVAEPLLLDFEDPGNSPAQGLFGDFQEALSGGTYIFPEAPAVADGEVQPLGLISDVTQGDWHISGLIAQQAGFGLFLECHLLDASRFVGLAFRIGGSIEGAESLSFQVLTAGNEVSPSWLLENTGSAPPSFGRCAPAERPFDGTCNAASFEVALSAESLDVFVPFSELQEGSPEPSVNPAEITKISWQLPAPLVDASGSIEPYAVDLRIDDIRFVEAQ